MATSDVDELGPQFVLIQKAQVQRRHGGSVERGLRARDRWDSRWEAGLAPAFAVLEPDYAKLTKKALKQHAKLEKGVADVVLRGLRAVVRAFLPAPTRFTKGALPVYMSLASDMSEDAGQHTLDDLGLNQTFRWTGVRDMPRDMFAVRGSKVIQQAYGTHLDRLTNIVIDATKPGSPKTQAEVQKQIREAWPALTRSQVSTISRTEVASVWETSRINAMAANEVAWYDISIAKGPSIGPPKSEKVCRECLDAASGGPYPLQEVPRLPLHPNCRCTTLPALTKDWLPPAEPWSGNTPPLETYPAPVPE